MKSFLLDLSAEELNIVFNCLIGSASCPPEHGELVNRVYQLIRANDILGDTLYSDCPNFKRK